MKSEIICRPPQPNKIEQRKKIEPDWDRWAGLIDGTISFECLMECANIAAGKVTRIRHRMRAPACDGLEQSLADALAALYLATVGMLKIIECQPEERP